MTRIAIVAASESLRASLARALADTAEFDVVAAGASVTDVGDDAEVVLVARESTSRRTTVTRDETTVVRALSSRERQVLALLADGLGNKQIAARLGISPNTVKTHLEIVFEKLGVSSRAEAVTAAFKRGLLIL
jgi:DNA-binding CsgD family transcriptional regulator